MQRVESEYRVNKQTVRDAPKIASLREKKSLEPCNADIWQYYCGKVYKQVRSQGTTRWLDKLFVHKKVAEGHAGIRAMEEVVRREGLSGWTKSTYVQYGVDVWVLLSRPATLRGVDPENWACIEPCEPDNVLVHVEECEPGM